MKEETESDLYCRSTQWAAVAIHSSLIRVPPQKWLRSIHIDTLDIFCFRSVFDWFSKPAKDTRWRPSRCRKEFSLFAPSSTVTSFWIHKRKVLSGWNLLEEFVSPSERGKVELVIVQLLLWEAWLVDLQLGLLKFCQLWQFLQLLEHLWHKRKCQQGASFGLNNGDLHQISHIRNAVTWRTKLH